jgi:Spx/MgsR family transcriptional regulator
MYGIPNCDTVKKAKKALEEKSIEFEFVDFKKVAPTEKDLKRWKKAMGEWPVNPRGRTFKVIKEEFEAATDKKKVELMAENTSAIKRPILENNGEVIAFGFDKEVYSEL